MTNTQGSFRLKKPYTRVKQGGAPSYGGNQHWSDDANLQAMGCGVVACTDLLFYLQGRSGEGLNKEYYLAMLKQNKKSFLMIRKMGITGFALAFGLNRLMRKHGLPYRARWGVMPWNLRRRTEEMLRNDIPVIFAIGWDFPFLWQSHGLPLYKKKPEGWQARQVNQGNVGETVSPYQQVKEAHKHYMMITALEGDWAKISTWGESYWISWSEYEHLAKRYGGVIFSNICYVHRI